MLLLLVYDNPSLFSDYHVEWQSVHDTEKPWWSLGFGGNYYVPAAASDSEAATGMFLSEEVCVEIGYEWYGSRYLTTLDYHYCYISGDGVTHKEEELSESVFTATGGYGPVSHSSRLGMFVRIFTPQVYTFVTVGSRSYDHFVFRVITNRTMNRVESVLYSGYYSGNDKHITGVFKTHYDDTIDRYFLTDGSPQ